MADPTGLSYSVASSTWNSVNVKVSISDWGSGSDPWYLEAKVFTTDSNSYWPESGKVCKSRWEQYYTTSAKTYTFTINNSDEAESSGTINIRGCQDFKIAGGAFRKNSGNAHSMGSTVYHLPPAPLQTLSVASQTPVDTKNAVTIKLNITGGSSTNNESKDVRFYYCYRYSTDGGTTWVNKPDGYWPAHGWAGAGTGKPWETKQPTFEVPYGALVEVKALQQYYVDSSHYYNSATKDLARFQATQATAPTGTVEVISMTPHSITLKGSVTNWGHPSNYQKESGSGNRNSGILQVNKSTDASKGGREKGMTTAPQTIELTNANGLTHGVNFNLLPGETAYPDMWLTNGLKSAFFRPSPNYVTLPDIKNYVPLNNKSIKVQYGYIGLEDGKAHAIKKIYVSKNGKATLVY